VSLRASYFDHNTRGAVSSTDAQPPHARRHGVSTYGRSGAGQSERDVAYAMQLRQRVIDLRDNVDRLILLAPRTKKISGEVAIRDLHCPRQVGRLGRLTTAPQLRRPIRDA
jgi:hypothetical protein